MGIGIIRYTLISPLHFQKKTDILIQNSPGDKAIWQLSTRHSGMVMLFERKNIWNSGI